MHDNLNLVIERRRPKEMMIVMKNGNLEALVMKIVMMKRMRVLANTCNPLILWSEETIG